MLSFALHNTNLELIVNDNSEEYSLIRKANTGDKSAFKELFERNVSQVYALCLRISGSPESAEELTQDVFIKAWEKLSTFRFESKFSTWLHSIAVNEFLMMKRSRKRFLQKFTSTGDIINYETNLGHENAGYAESIDLEKAISKLPKQARLVFVLHDVEGYKHNEISDKINIGIGTSKAHLHRARKLLREALIK